MQDEIRKNKVASFYGSDKEGGVTAVWINEEGGLTIERNVDYRDCEQEISINLIACLRLRDYLNEQFPY